MNIASEKTVEGISGIAFLRKCVIAPRKMRMVADLIRGKNVVLALNILKCEQKKCSAYFKKLLLSAMANYQRKCEMKKIEDLNTKDLVISTLKVDGDGMLKRLLLAPQGRAFRIRRRLSNVSISSNDIIFPLIYVLFVNNFSKLFKSVKLCLSNDSIGIYSFPSPSHIFPFVY